MRLRENLYGLGENKFNAINNRKKDSFLEYKIYRRYFCGHENHKKYICISS